MRCREQRPPKDGALVVSNNIESGNATEATPFPSEPGGAVHLRCQKGA
jgi:hypothetical protein